MTNPYDNPWFFHWLGPFRIGWILLDFHWRLYKQFWEVFSESSGISGICINCNFLIFVRLPTSSHQTSMCWAKVCISRCGRSCLCCAWCFPFDFRWCWECLFYASNKSLHFGCGFAFTEESCLGRSWHCFGFGRCILLLEPSPVPQESDPWGLEYMPKTVNGCFNWNSEGASIRRCHQRRTSRGHAEQRRCLPHCATRLFYVSAPRILPDIFPQILSLMKGFTPRLHHEGNLSKYFGRPWWQWFLWHLWLQTSELFTFSLWPFGRVDCFVWFSDFWVLFVDLKDLWRFLSCIVSPTATCNMRKHMQSAQA